MDEMEEKLGAILNNPQMMQQIMAMAQGFQDTSQKPPPRKPEHQKDPCRPEPQKEPCLPEIDMGMVQNLSRLARQSTIDKREQTLLRALAAYLSKERIGKLEKAMKAAKLAKIASGALNQGGQPFLGR